MTSVIYENKLTVAPLFSVVTAVHNSQEFLPTLLKSFEQQTISADKIEYLFIDDKSTDDSLNIVLAWAKQHPNVTVLANLQNLGPAASRAAGYHKAQGIWVTTVDSDDILDPDYFTEIAKYAGKYPKVAMLTARMLTYRQRWGFAGAKIGLDYKYRSGNRLVEIDTDPSAIQLGATAFLRTEVLKAHNLTFNPRVRPAFEDAHLIGRYLLCFDNPQVALVSTAHYFYRVRDKSQDQAQQSIMQNSWRNPDTYTTEIVYGHIDLLQQTKQKYGFVPTWAANMVLYSLSWQFTEALTPQGSNAWITQNKDLYFEFLHNLKQVFALLQPEQIYSFTARDMPAHLLLILCAHYHRPVLIACAPKNTKDTGKTDTKEIIVELYTQNNPTDKVLIDVAGTIHIPGMQVQAHYLFDQIFGYRAQFKVTSLESQIIYDGQPLSFDSLPTGSDGYRPAGKLRRVLYDWSGKTSPMSAISFLAEVNLALRKLLPAAERHNTYQIVVKKTKQIMPKVIRRVILRSSLQLARLAEKMPGLKNPYQNGWLIMDRFNGANDNGEHFYRYLCTHRKEIPAWFLLSPKADDAPRLRSEPGFRIPPSHSWALARQLLGAKTVVTSDWAYADLAAMYKMLRPRERPQIMFIQHGIIMNDISMWLNNVPVDMMVSSVAGEYKFLSHSDSPFRFPPGAVVKLGLTRFDRLKDLAICRGQKTVNIPTLTIMPTWRNSLRDDLRKASQPSQQIAVFKASQFCQTWQQLLNHPDILQKMRDKELRINFVAHPNLVPVLDGFEFDPAVAVHNLRLIDFQQLLVQTDLFLTDYSSAAFDAVIAGAEVAYYQFDQAEFFGGQQSMRRGWFDYVSNGYGPLFTKPEQVHQWIFTQAGSEEIHRQRAQALRAEIPDHICQSTFQEIQRRLTLE